MDGELDLDALIARINAMSPEEREQARERARIELAEMRRRVQSVPDDDEWTEEDVVRAVKEVRAEMRAERERAAAGRR
jgi:hypothetical protein